MADVNPKDLKTAIKALNDTGALESKIKVVGTKTEVLLELFTEAVEAMNSEEMEIPDEAIEVYNILYAEEEESKGEEIKTEPKPEPEPEPEKEEETLKKKAPAKKAKGKAPIAKDDFGYRIDSQNSLFCQAIKKKAMAMKEVKELDWNKRKAVFYNIFNSLMERNLAEKDEETGIMTMKEVKDITIDKIEVTPKTEVNKENNQEADFTYTGHFTITLKK